MSESSHSASLASLLTERILTTSVITAARSGVFIRTPRKIKNSSFFRTDLAQSLREKGANVLYVNLSKIPNKDSGLQIVEVIRDAVINSKETSTQLVKLLGISLATDHPTLIAKHIGIGNRIGLSSALVALSQDSYQMIVLIVENADLLMSSLDGMATLFALKAARDELNSTKHLGLRLVFVSADEVKLLSLSSDESQPFFCAPLIFLDRV